MEWWFAATLFTSAALLFCVQPMIAKMVLPLWGGAPAVWNTCMLFFQAALLAGYAYAHWSVRALGVKKQVFLHLPLLLVPATVLPIAIGAGTAQWGSNAGLTAGLLVLLTASVGLPFFVLSTTSPLLQRWYATTGRDPYFLYAASNLGSMISLAAYPLVLEPFVGLRQISRFWSIGYGVLVVLVIGCAILMRRTPALVEHVEPKAQDADAPSAAVDDAPPTLKRKLRWVALAFVPSSLMLGVTTYLTTDIAPVPLLWVAPLALYLLTFILVFAEKRILPHALMVKFLPLGVAASTILALGEVSAPLWMVVLAHLTTFFIATMVCHGELANDRPSPKHLTEFYLLLSVGGVIGGIYNALLAPYLFTRVLEYPISLVMAAFARKVTPNPDDKPARRWLDVAMPVLGFAITAAVVLGWRQFGKAPERVTLAMLFCIPILAVYHTRFRPIRFAASLGAIQLAGFLLYSGMHGQTLHEERSFFGVLRVTQADDGDHRFVHGITLHGRQGMTEDRRHEPLGYYTKTGPIGEVITWKTAEKPDAKIGVVGLGVGALAAYAKPAQSWTFYEIDPAVVRIAMDPRYFTYLTDAFGAAGPRMRVGDARIRLQEDTSDKYDVLVLDAFSSDAIPTHLLTKQAIQLYSDRLAPGGVLAIHISNKFLDLAPIMGNLARATDMVGLGRYDMKVSDEELRKGKAHSRWVVLARTDKDVGALAERGWKTLPERPDLGVWTDDFSNILRIMSW